MALAGLIAVVATSPSCKGKGAAIPQPAPAAAPAAQERRPRTGLFLRLGNGPAAARVSRPPAAPAPAETIPDDRAAKLFSQLPAMAASGLPEPPALPPRSRHAPPAGQTLTAAFPPPVQAPPPAEAAGQGSALSVLRRAPEGVVPDAQHVSVTFSHPMVALTAAADAARSVPVRLTPAPAGAWRWVGTRTAVFEPTQGFARGTRYQVEIPAGTRALGGEPLAEAQAWTFTPVMPRLLSVEGLSPPGSYGDRHSASHWPVVTLGFSDDVDAAKVVAALRVRTQGKTVPARLATQAEIDRTWGAYADRDGDTVTFTVTERLPAGAWVTVDLDWGLPGVERQSFTFRTHGPLLLAGVRCDAVQGDCPPLAEWQLRFSNPLDEAALDPALVRVSPALPGLQVDVDGETLSVRGFATAGTTYRVTIPASLSDVHGQTLGQSQTATVRVGRAEPRIYGPSGMLVVDPAAEKPTLDVVSVGVSRFRVRLYRVGPEHWPSFSPQDSRRDEPAPDDGDDSDDADDADVWEEDDDSEAEGDPAERLVALLGPPVVDMQVPAAHGPAELAETSIDLGAALAGGRGQLIAVVQPDRRPERGQSALLTWVQATGIGLDAFVDGTELVAWATRLADGKPLAGVDLGLAPGGATARTDARGMARLPLATSQRAATHVLVARHGRDVAILPENADGWLSVSGFVRARAPGELRWYVTDDLGTYRPGDEMHVKGWLRLLAHKRDGLASVRGLVDAVSYTLTDERGAELGRGQVRVNPAGGFHFTVTVPADASLGQAALRLVARGPGAARPVDQHHHGVQIQTYRNPRFEVTVRPGPGPHLVGEPLAISSEARYYAGGSAAGARVSWLVKSEPASFTPPGRDGFAFGASQRWWMPAFEAIMLGEGSFLQEWKATTDAQGRHVLAVDPIAASPPWPMLLRVDASVDDVDRQSESDDANILVHPSALYVGLASPAPFVQPGEPLAIQAICVDHDGHAVPGRPLSVRAERLDWPSGFRKAQVLDSQICAVTSGEHPVSCSFTARESGLYRVTARVVDARGRPSESQLGVWVAGSRSARPPWDNVDDALVVPDRRSYRPGDTARILVQAPFAPAEGILTLRGQGIEEALHFTMREPSIVLDVPITEALVPDVDVHVALAGARPRADGQGQPRPGLPLQPALAEGDVALDISPAAYALAVTATPRERTLAPGSRTTIDLLARDAAGQPVPGAEVAVVVADESVLALASHDLPDPMPIFYADRASEVEDHHLRSHLWLARLGVDARDVDRLRYVMDRAEAVLGYGVGSGRGGKRGSARFASDIRDDFRALAVFAPEVRTDAAGRAQVSVTMPDNLTRYRVMAVAAAGTRQFGKAESSITTRKPLMVQPSLPRFLHAGDTFELPVVLHNQGDAPARVEVAVRAAGVRLTAGMGRAVVVPARDRVEVRFPAVAERVGSARVQIAAGHDTASDATEVALPVWSPAAIETVATYGTLSDLEPGAVRQPVRMPAGARTDLGELTVTTSATQLQALTDAVLYLLDHPYDCSEQVASRLLAVIALRDVLPSFQQGAPAPTQGAPARIDAAIRRDLATLARRQRWSGGFALWDDDAVHPFATIHVAHALARARAAGHAVSPMLDAVEEYLDRIERELPERHGKAARQTSLAYALYVRGLLGRADPASPRRLMAELDTLPLDAAGWLYAAMAGQPSLDSERAALRRHLVNRANESAGAAHFTAPRGEDGHLVFHAEQRANAVILEALLANPDAATSDLVPKLVRGLLAARVRGRWSSTQDNVFALLALARYVQTYERDTPAFLARAWLGDRLAGEHRFRGRTAAQHRIEVPMRALAQAAAASPASPASPAGPAGMDVVLQKTGPGRLYYRIGMRYAPASADVPALDRGFLVERSYEAVDAPGDVVRLADGAWKLRAGARVRVRLRMLTHDRRRNVALVDRLPAGLEPLNPALTVTGSIPDDPEQAASPYARTWTWYEHQSLRDERAEAFTSLLPAGVHLYSYVARATTPGRFVAPPAQAEEMYDPETMGRSATARVIVE